MERSMELEQVFASALALVEQSRSALVGSIGEGGYPNIKGMFHVFQASGSVQAGQTGRHLFRGL